MPEKRRPRKGSLAYTPRKRAPRQKPKVRSWPEEDEVGLLGFVGYKAGMTHVFMIDDREGSVTKDREINVSVTVLETPPIVVCAGRVYGTNLSGESVLTEVWSSGLTGELSDVVEMSEDYDQEAAMEDAEEFIKGERADEVRALVHTQPRLSSVPKKKPGIMEIPVGGNSLEERWDHVKDVLGEEIGVSEVFEEGEYVDSVGITKGKGTEGPVQRWGIKVQPRKVQQARRHVGALGPWKPRAIMRTVPAAGQTGYHQRTEYNKRILRMGEDGEEVTPEGGFLRFGEINNEFIVLKGSVPGSTGRLICLRKAIRKKEGLPTNPPTITYIDTASQQGG